MKIGYGRVSTHDQSLDLQIDALEKHGCEKLYLEKDSGIKDDRHKLKEPLEFERSGDTRSARKADKTINRVIK